MVGTWGLEPQTSTVSISITISHPKVPIDANSLQKQVLAASAFAAADAVAHRVMPLNSP